MKHHEFTLFKKEVGEDIIRMMFLPLMPNVYKKIKGSKIYLVIQYPKSLDIKIPRKKGKGDRAKFIKGLKNKWWFDDGQKAADKFNSI